MEAVGRKTGWHGPGFRPVMENGAEWVSVTMKTRWGPTRVLKEFEEELRRDGWKVDFKANWWSPANYGVAMFEAERDGKRKVVVLKWAVTGEERIVKVEGKGAEEGRREFFSLVDMVSDNLMYDSVLRSMMDRY